MSQGLEKLSPREREVLELLGKGLTNQAIAERLDIAVDTVHTHVSHILRKLGARSRWQAADIAKS
jgi:RNA polymerase sigma factor (sigma-70 family)